MAVGGPQHGRGRKTPKPQPLFDGLIDPPAAPPPLTPMEFTEVSGANRQPYLSMMAVPELPLLSRAEQLRVLIEHKKKYGLDDLQLIGDNAYKLRPPQHAITLRILDHRNPAKALLVAAGTGAGKTGAAMQRGMNEKSRGKDTLVVIPVVGLGKQGMQMIGRFTAGKLEVATYTGRNSPQYRERHYPEEFPFTIETERVVWNDFKKINWSRIGTVIFDEPQLMQLKDGTIPLVERLRNEHPEIQVILLSATPAINPQKLTHLRHSIGPHTFLRMATEVEIEAERIKVAGGTPPPAAVQPEIFDVPLATDFKDLIHGFRTECIRCAREILPEFEQIPLFKKPDEVDLWVPTFGQRQALQKIAQSKTGKQAKFDFSLWSECNKWAALFNRATMLGRHPAVDLFCYRYAQRHIQGGWSLTEIAEDDDPNRPGYQTPAEQRITGNEKVLKLVKKEVEGTLFELLFEFDNWDDILAAGAPVFKELKGEEMTQNTVERRARNNAANVLHGARWGKTAKARYFFDQALRQYAHRQLSDSFKADYTSELLERHLDVLLDGRSFVFTWLTRHADFLAEFIEYRFRKAGMKPVSIHGKSRPDFQDEGMEMFRDGRANILFTTLAYAGTGIDAPNARMAIVASILNKSGAALTQGIGRVVGRAGLDAYIHFLATKGSRERQFFEGAMEAAEELQREIRKWSEAVLPEFRVA